MVEKIDGLQAFGPSEADVEMGALTSELALYQRIDRELAKSTGLEPMLDLALEAAVSLTGAKTGQIGRLEVNANGDTILRLWVRDRNDEQILEEVVHEPAVAAQLPDEAAVGANGSHVTVSTKNGTMLLTAPIRAGKSIAGLIRLESCPDSSFALRDIAFAGRLADRIAAILANSRLNETVLEMIDAKSEFTSVVCHELRIPLTSIKGYADLLANGKTGTLSDLQNSFLSAILRNTDRMGVLIRDLAEINRIESGRAKFNRSQFDVSTLIYAVIDKLDVRLKEKQHQLAVRVADDLPPVSSDKEIISRVVTQLIENASSYTPNGGKITVRAETNGRYVNIQVSDNGIGICEEDQSSVFNPFFRSSDSMVREQPGWGLGLALAKLRVESMGGQIEFRSESGKGSTFAFEIPMVAQI